MSIQHAEVSQGRNMLDEFTTKGGASLRYLDLDLRGDWDSDPGQPVVLLHGLGCDWRVWRRQAGWLAHARRVVAPNIRGSGGSGWRTPGWTTADMAADVHDLVIALGLDRPALAGISMGGTIAMQYAADYPGDISRLVLTGTYPEIPAEFAAVRDAQLQFIETHTLREIARERVPALFTGDADPRLGEWLADMLAHGQLDGYRGQARPTLLFRFTGRLGEIGVPTTIIHGTEDRSVPAFLAERLAAGIAGSVLHLIDGEGHFPNLEAPARFNPLLAGALGVPSGYVPAG